MKQSAVKAQLTINRVNGADGHVSVKCTTKDMSARAGREYLGLEQEIYFEHGETSKILDVVISGVKVQEMADLFCSPSRNIYFLHFVSPL